MPNPTPVNNELCQEFDLPQALFSALSELSPDDIDFYCLISKQLNACKTSGALQAVAENICSYLLIDICSFIHIGEDDCPRITFSISPTHPALTAQWSSETDIQMLKKLAVHESPQIDPKPLAQLIFYIENNTEIKQNLHAAFPAQIETNTGLLLLHRLSHKTSTKEKAASQQVDEERWAHSHNYLCDLIAKACLRQTLHLNNVNNKHKSIENLRNILDQSDKGYSVWQEGSGWIPLNKKNQILNNDPHIDGYSASKEDNIKLLEKINECKTLGVGFSHNHSLKNKDGKEKYYQSNIGIFNKKPIDSQLIFATTTVSETDRAAQKEEINFSEYDRWLNTQLSNLLNHGDIPAVENFLKEIAIRFGASRCYIRTFDKLTEDWKQLNSWKIEGEKEVEDMLSEEEREEFSAIVSKIVKNSEKHEICIDDMSTTKSKSAKFYGAFGMKSVLVEPMVFDDELKGYIGVGRLHKKKWTLQEKRTLTICAESIYRTLVRLYLLDRLATNEARFDAAMEISSSGIWELNLNKQEMYFSPSFYHMLGYSKDELNDHILEKIDQLILEEDKQKLAEQFDNLYKDKSQNEIYHETRHKTKDGRIIWVSGRGKVIKRDSNGSPQIVMGANTDVTDQKNVQKSLQHAHAEAEKANQTKGEFLARMSHEIRTPMNAIIGMSYLVQQTELNNEQKGYIDDISSAAAALLNIIDDILDFSKIEAGKLSIEYAPFDLYNELARINKLISLKVSEKNIQVRLIIDEQVPKTVIGDKTRIGQVITNLLSNAVKFTEEGEITVKVSLSPGEYIKGSTILLFSVSDTGIGLSEEQARHLFKAYEQADGSITRKYGGTGLGLTISKNLVELMGGKISVASEEGSGTTFNFSIMFRAEQRSKNTIDNDDKEPATLDNYMPFLKNKHILLVEDNIVNQRVAQGILTKSKIRTHVVNNGQEALDLLHSLKESFDAVLMDIEMPILDGIETARIIRSTNSSFQHIPIIAMTAHAMTGDKEKCFSVGMNDHIAKPINPTVLYQTLAIQMKDRVSN